ncbi:acylneuraminate cytidylyltransferase family protein [Pseudomonas tohonis]|uniref:acylneuraminate cytidylyltransferase family protein n=1 Tax=Pseudomonas tohonis TaxID=2725477 RepID=UPI001F425B54|nr:acylneuraminate cytidylyltransferase family protein [Pseudomonas tohonis]
MSRTLAVIPARAGSKRVPGKNTRIFAGKPLLQWTLEFACSYHGFDEVLLSTDCEDCAAIASVCGKPVPWMRPSELAGDETGTVDVVLHALSEYQARGQCFDRVAVLQPTTPFRRADRWNEAYRLLELGVIAVVGASVAERHPYWSYWLDSMGAMSPCFPGKSTLRSQDLPAAATINGALYWIDTSVLRQARSLTPEGVHAVLLDDALESIDIDTEVDWVHAEEALLAAGVLK